MQQCPSLPRVVLILAVVSSAWIAEPLRAQEIELTALPPVFEATADEPPIETAPAADVPAPADFARQLETLQAEVNRLRDAEAKRTTAEEMKTASDESKPSFRISPELQVDTYFFGQNTASRDTVGNMPDGSAFRRARVAALGNYKFTEYRLEMDFAQPGRPTFLDVWGAINELPYVGQLKIGNFFEPIGLERLTSNRFAPFLERNLPDQPYDPQRSPGAQLQNIHSDNHGIWTVGVFRSRTDNWADSVTDVGAWCVDGRLTWMPYYDEESGGRYYMHLGTAHSYRSATDHLVQFRAQPEARLGAATPNVPFFVDTGLISALSWQLHEVEFACSLGRLWLQAEYFLTPVEQINGTQLWFTGWYAQAGYFLTGEHRPFRRETATFDRVMPFSEFFRVRTKRGIARGPGAWEVAARISHVDLTSANIGGGRLTDLTFGVNWYLSPYTRITTNYIHAFLDPASYARAGSDSFGTRFQYDY